ncbi:ORF6C domain-containing protein [Bacteroides acidifaciens]|uniref:ORF6C domain-containing protein n=1 Tax=Bacteroides acidifaciens TaxID=85831 RepID=UPI0025AFB0AA|nr:ORF6C domain-containing protein [Bacteroides acidifaciens]
MNEIMTFSNSEFGEIRTVTIDGEPWFVAKDISEKLGYARTPNMIKLVDDEDKRNISSSDLEQQVYKQNYTIGIINESGLYAAIFGSKQENAKKFKKWVTSEVLPSIRKTGAYGQARLPMTIPEQIQIIAQGYGELHEEVQTIKKDLEDFKNDMPILGVEESKITNAVKKKGVECLGGKESNAYNDRSVRGRLYSDLHNQLRRQFGVSTYKAIKRNQAETAVSIIQCYVPPLVLSETIDTLNAQQTLDV